MKLFAFSFRKIKKIRMTKFVTRDNKTYMKINKRELLLVDGVLELLGYVKNKDGKDSGWIVSVVVVGSDKKLFRK